MVHRHDMIEHRAGMLPAWKCQHCDLMVYSASEATNVQGRWPLRFGLTVISWLSIIIWIFLVCVVLWAFTKPLPAHGSELRLTVCHGYCPGVGLHPQIQHPSAPLGEAEREETAARIRRWETYCRPTPVWNGLAYQMHYDHEGCDLGRMSD